MNEYQKLVKDEAKAFYESAREEFEEDEEEFGGRSDRPNLAKWIDRHGKLSERVDRIASKWTHKDHLWVENNTRNRDDKAGGDFAGRAYGSFLKDVRQEIKKLAKAARKR